MIHINTYDTEGSLELENAARMGEAMLARGERYDYAADEVGRRFYMRRSGVFPFWHPALPMRGADVDPSAYPYEAVLPTPREIAAMHGDLRRYRYRVVERPQGGQRVEAIFLSIFEGVERWRQVKRGETIEALAQHAAPHAAMADRIIPTPTGAAYFWAPEVLLFGDLYLTGNTRRHVDLLCSAQVDQARPAPAHLGGFCNLVDLTKPRFWSPELPEVVFRHRCPLAPEAALKRFTGGPGGEWRRVTLALQASR